MAVVRILVSSRRLACSFPVGDLMTRWCALLTSAVIVFSALDCAAAVIERDWKTLGDGLLTFDTVNKREWLDLPLQFSIPTPRYDNVVAELGPGGMFEGFRVASIQDVTALAESAGMTIGTSDYNTNAASANVLIDLLGRTQSPDATMFRTSRGFVSETFLLGPATFHVTGILDVSEFDDGRAELYFVTRIDGHPFSGTPVFLFRAVPEPSSLVIAALGALARGVLR